MGDKRTKQRITSKIDELPEDLRMKVDVMLADNPIPMNILANS